MNFPSDEYICDKGAGSCSFFVVSGSVELSTEELITDITQQYSTPPTV